MKFEGINRQENSESLEHKKLRISNEIQMQIMGMMCSPDQGQECFDNWIDSYGSSFNIIFNEVINNDPEYLDKWDKNIGDEKSKSLDFYMEELNKLDKRAA